MEIRRAFVKVPGGSNHWVSEWELITFREQFVREYIKSLEANTIKHPHSRLYLPDVGV